MQDLCSAMDQSYSSKTSAVVSNFSVCRVCRHFDRDRASLRQQTAGCLGKDTNLASPQMNKFLNYNIKDFVTQLFHKVPLLFAHFNIE